MVEIKLAHESKAGFDEIYYFYLPARAIERRELDILWVIILPAGQYLFRLFVCVFAEHQKDSKGESFKITLLIDLPIKFHAFRWNHLLVNIATVFLDNTIITQRTSQVG